MQVNNKATPADVIDALRPLLAPPADEGEQLVLALTPQYGGEGPQLLEADYVLTDKSFHSSKLYMYRCGKTLACFQGF